ncbi:hypothetical protein ACH5RR_024168 [Cinchona calisaya]|uniref:Trichome birefringence-like N-terminal domain-containing protein n=1 Tax=Cinchona calisaya TaxID=153742 RepID=A0ABD2ZCR2_9GENT
MKQQLKNSTSTGTSSSSNNLNNVKRNNNPLLSSIFVKFAICFLLLGLVYRLYSSSFVQFSPIEISSTETTTIDGGDDDREVVVAHKTLPPVVSSESSPVSATTDPPPPPPSMVDLYLDENNKNKTTPQTAAGECDLFVGDWVPDPAGPYYTNSTCFSIEAHQNCMMNGRPDTDYIYWRWNPRDCDLPKFNGEKFLHFMRNKSLAFIGDSIMRNHAQSLLCTLSQVEEALDVYHDKQYKSRRWSFPVHNFTLSVVWAPFLAKATIFEDDNGVSTDIIQLHLDELDAVWTQQYKNFDYIFTAGGKWFLKPAVYYENNTIVGCHGCQGKNITEVGFYYAYRKVVNSTLKFVTSSKHTVYTFLRTTTPDHFENGEWHNGGYCNRTKPFRDGEVDMNSIDGILRKIELEEFEMASGIGSQNGITLKLFDTSYLSLLRPDGHPGAYRNFQPFAGKDKNAKVQNDCLHWCLPGPIDSWNDLMLKMVLNS